MNKLQIDVLQKQTNKKIFQANNFKVTQMSPNPEEKSYRPLAKFW